MQKTRKKKTNLKKQRSSNECRLIGVVVVEQCVCECLFAKQLQINIEKSVIRYDGSVVCRIELAIRSNKRNHLARNMILIFFVGVVVAQQCKQNCDCSWASSSSCGTDEHCLQWLKLRCVSITASKRSSAC